MNFALQKRRGVLSPRVTACLMLVAAGLCLALFACVSSPPPLSPLSKNATVLAFGDSLTYGTGAASADSYPAQLQKIIRRQVVAAGVPGETSEQALRRLPRLLRHHRPALVIVCTGGNDFCSVCRHNKPKKISIAFCKRPRCRGGDGVNCRSEFSLWESNHPLYARVADGRWWMEDEIMKAVLHDNSLKSDRIHPNAAGYRRIAEAVAMLLARAGAI